MKTKRCIKGFTLIELLVVIAIIALLMSIVTPAMRKAKDYARKIICQSNYKQLGIAIGTYGSQTDYNFQNYKSAIGMSADERQRHWFFHNGTGDYAHEAQPYAIQHLLNSDILPDRQVFFCPGIKNLSYDQNYPVSRVVAGNYTPLNTDGIYEMARNGGLPSNDRPLFWSSHVWLWKKEVRGDVTSVNNISSGAMMCDMTNGSWQFAANTNTTFQNFFTAVGVSRLFQHGNVLMSDLSVKNPTDKDEELVDWLWNSNLWGGSGY